MAGHSACALDVWTIEKILWALVSCSVTVLFSYALESILRTQAVFFCFDCGALHVNWILTGPV